MRFNVLDVYCCQGAATKGYQDAGATGTFGVDIDEQSRYFEVSDAFQRMDAIAFLREFAEWIREHFDFVHASPPCQFYSATSVLNGNQHPDLIGPTREALQRIGLPYVMENVVGAAAEMTEDSITLCGAMFGLHTYRHRLFEPGGWTLKAPEHPEHEQRTVKMGRPLKEGDFYHAVGNFTGVDYVRRDMGVHWMNRDGIRECIPPAYTEYIGQQFLAQREGFSA
ncbi:SAM-dependent methyltransferase [Streptomyces sp. NPDC006235]|uniref:SAM-dependent methyltransferase n=1 Tax=Streptomyces sp. NPDC006235 TaxID=3156736 RepID=UPI0033AC78A9